MFNYVDTNRILQEPEAWVSFRCPECGAIRWLRRPEVPDINPRSGDGVVGSGVFEDFGPWFSFSCEECDFFGGIPPECDGWKPGPEDPF